MEATGAQQVTGSEIAAEAVKTGLGLLMAGAIGALATMLRMPSRKEFDALKTRVESFEAQLQEHKTSSVEIRTLLDTIKESLAQIRRDIRDLRGERNRDTDP